MGQNRDSALCLAQVLHCFPKLLLTCIVESGKEGSFSIAYFNRHVPGQCHCMQSEVIACGLLKPMAKWAENSWMLEHCDAVTTAVCYRHNCILKVWPNWWYVCSDHLGWEPELNCFPHWWCKGSPCCQLPRPYCELWLPLGTETCPLIFDTFRLDIKVSWSNFSSLCLQATYIIIHCHHHQWLYKRGVWDIRPLTVGSTYLSTAVYSTENRTQYCRRWLFHWDAYFTYMLVFILNFTYVKLVELYVVTDNVLSFDRTFVLV